LQSAVVEEGLRVARRRVVVMMMVVVMMIAAVLMRVMRVVSARRRLEALVTAEILMQVVMQAGRSVNCEGKAI